MRFATLDAVRQHLEKLDNAKIETTGRWTAGQILYHLAAAFEESSKPQPQGMRRPSRLMKLPLRLVVFTGMMPRNMKIPPAVEARLTPPDGADLDTQLARLRNAIDTFEKAQSPAPMHPVLGVLTRNEWRKFHLRHCELHLKHIIVR